MVRLSAGALQEFIAEIFGKSGCSADESARIAKYLVAANLTGHDSHGVVRVPRYVQMKGEGRVVADRKIAVLIDTPVLAVVDGQYGFGQTVAPQAVELAIAKCRQHGLAAVALRNAGHIGRVGDWAAMAAEAGLISVHFVNAAGSVLVAPFGGVDRRFSTAPFCVGVPRADADPVILDFATSVVAEGKVLVASRGGKKLPAEALVGPDGTVSGDPHLLYGDYQEGAGPRDYGKGEGAIRAFGEHKGSGLALICELLGGALTGNGATQESRPFANGMLSFYVDAKRMDPQAAFSAEVARYIAAVKSARPVVSGGEVLTPGEPEARMRAERLAGGVPLTDDIWASIVRPRAKSASRSAAFKRRRNPFEDFDRQGRPVARRAVALDAACFVENREDRMLKIWGRNTSSNVQKVMWAIGELGLEHERIDVGGKFGGNKEPAYLALNPNGLVPTLQEDDLAVWESNTIVRYLAARYGAGKLEPADWKSRALASQWMDWQLSVLGPAITPAFWGLIRTPPEKRDHTAITASQAKTTEAVKLLDAALAKHAYVVGAAFSMGDIPVGIMAYRFRQLVPERPKLEHFERWYAAIAARQAFKDHVSSIPLQ